MQKADVDRMSVEIDLCAKDFVELLGAVTHLDLQSLLSDSGE
jgi:hypothetical protein